MKRVLILVFLIQILFIVSVFSQNSYLLGYEMPNPNIGNGSACLELKNRNTVTTDIFYSEKGYSNLTISFRDSTGQILWHRSIRGIFLSITPLLENHKGELYFFCDINTSGCILKTDSMGNMLWCRSYGLITSFWKGIICENENMVICGSYSDEFDNIGNGGFLIKIDPKGEVIWQKSIGHGIMNDPHGSYFYDLKCTKDGGFIICGDKPPKIGCGLPAGSFVVKTDGEGNLIWSNIYGCAYSFSIEVMSDGTFVNTGFDLNKKLMYIYNIAPDGKLNWAKRYDIKNVSEIGLIPAYLIDKFDHYLLFANGYHSIHLFNLKLDGEINWMNSSSSDSFKEFANLSVASDGGYFITGYGNDSIVDYKAKSYSFTMKTDINGEMPCLFTKDYNPPIEVTDYFPQIESGALEKDLTLTPVEIILKDTTIEINQQIICYTTATQEVKEKAISFQLYPNPASNALSIDINKGNWILEKSSQVYISDGLGRVLISVKPSFEGHSDIDISGLLPGIYFASLRAGSYIMGTAKFIVVR